MKAIKQLLLLCILWLNTSLLYAQTSLTAGDIAFVGWNGYDNGPSGTVNEDQIAFVLLKDISPNTVIYFTDYGWCNTPTARFQVSNPSGCSGGIPPYGSQSDGILKWTSSSTATMTCGTLVWIKTKFLTSNNAPLTSAGTVVGVSATASTAATANPQYVSLPTSGDQVFAFQVAAGDVAALSTGVINNPTLISAMNMKVAWDTSLDFCASINNQSTLPAALANASIIIPSQNGSDLSGRVNARFNCSGNTTASPSVLRANMANSANWIFNQISADATGLYNFASFGCTFTCSASAPDITTQPTAQTTCDTRSASFTIVATNTTNYQWQISTNGGSTYTNLSNTGVYSNVTTATLNISNSTGLDGMFYKCIVSNASFSTNSNGVRLTVNRFVQQPTNATACSSCVTGFTAAARGLGLTFQWQISTDNGVSFSNIPNAGVYSGATTKTLSISSASGLNSLKYRCVLGGCASPINSNVVTMTVTGTTQTTLTQGDVAIVGLNTNDDNLDGTTQDDDVLFVLLKDIVAGTEVSLTDNGWNSSTQGFIAGCSTGVVKWVATSNLSCGTQVRVKAKYLLESNIGVVLPITAGGSGVYLSLANADFVFAFQGTTASPTMLYGIHTNAWAATQTTCSGGASALPTILNNSSYNIALARGAGGWSSANYNCTNVNDSPTQLRTSIGSLGNWATNTNSVSFPICTFSCINGAPQITVHPTNTITCDGKTATFSVTVPAGTNTYKWQIFNGSTWDYLTNGAVYSNVTSATLTINNATGLNGKQFRCEVTNAITFINSNSATLTVNRFNNQPINMTTCTGCAAAFSVVGLGSGLTFQWQESNNGGSTFGNVTNGGVYSGATTNILKISNATSPTNLNTRQYRVILGGCPSPINSNNVALTVSANSATSLVAGDITFIGFNTGDDGVNGITQDDEFAFILLKDINAGTEINFTDFGWRSDANAFHESNTTCGGALGSQSDGILKWIATSNFTCGTQVSIKCKYTMLTTNGVAYGTQSVSGDATAFLSLSTGGDQIFAYTGTQASPNLLAGLSMRTWDTSLTTCEATGNKSVKPAALNGFVIEFVGSSSVNYASYKCSAPTKDLPAIVRVATQNTTNWDVNSITPYTFPLACSFCCAASYTITTQPSSQSICSGLPTSFSVITSPSGQNFQWQVNTGAGFGNVPNTSPFSGATTNTLSIGIASSMNGYQFRCVITDVCGSTNSNTATLTVSSVSNPTSVLPAAAITVSQPTAISLSASCTSGNDVLWYNNPTTATSIGSGTSISVTPTVPGNYTYYALCRQTASPNCISPSRVATAQINYCVTAISALPNYSSLSQLVKSATTFSVNNIINNNSNITYQTGRFIELLPGFSVASGSVFKTQYGGCN